MTAIGKILVIINLLFSLVVAGFIVVVYAKRTNWEDAQKRWQATQQATEASRALAEKERDEERVAGAARVAEKDKEIAALQGQIKAKDATVAERDKALVEFKKAGNGEQFSLKGLQTELEKRKQEVTDLEGQVAAKDKDIVKYIDLKNQANDAKVAAEIKSNSYQARAERLEARVRETEIEIAKLRRSGGASGSAGIALVSTANPPPQSVEGVVTETSGRGDLMRISIGSDAGLEKGHTLDVYRLKPTPQYLGQIRLTDVRHNEAVGVPVDKLKAPVQKGDMVASDVSAKK